jgi:hypothetical protein
MKREGREAFPGKGNLKPGEAEVGALRQELERTRMGPRGCPDILKKALSVFAQPSR